MLICCADIRGLDASRARLSGRKNTAGGAFARSLLLFAAGEYWDLTMWVPEFGIWLARM